VDSSDDSSNENSEEDEEIKEKKKGGYIIHGDLPKAERKKLIKEENREKRKNKIPKHIKK